MELHHLTEIVREAVEVPDGQAHEDVALEVAGYIADVKYPAGEGPFEQLLASGSISTPAEAARYESNPKLHRLVCVIPQLLTDDEGLITLHQQTIAGEFGCTQGLVSTMIKLLKLHGLLELVHKELPGMRCARYRRRYGDEEPATTADLNENDLPF